MKCDICGEEVELPFVLCGKCVKDMYNKDSDDNRTKGKYILNKCPFCEGVGGNSGAFLQTYIDEEGSTWYYIECLDCGAKTGEYARPEQVIKVWNNIYTDH
jgi:ribosomal protein S27E